MDKKGLVFNVEAVSDFEYRFKNIRELSKDEIINLSKENQILFTDVAFGDTTFPSLIAFAPRCWFKSSEDFKNRLNSDLRMFIEDSIKHITQESVTAVGRLVDMMGPVSLSMYCEDELEINREYNCSIDTMLVDDIKVTIKKHIKISKLALELFNDYDETLSRLIFEDSAESFGKIRFNATRDNDKDDKSFETYTLEIPLFRDNDLGVKYIELISHIYNLYTLNGGTLWES